MQVVGGFFDSIVHAFKHIVDDVGAKLVPVVAPMFGLPPDAVAPLTALVMRAHAGSKDARAKIQRLREHGGTLKGRPVSPELVAPLLQRINVAVHDHPHFSHMQSHAKAAVAKERARRARAHA